MTRFSDLAILNIHQRKLENPSSTVTLSHTTFYLRFDSKDNILEASYQGPTNPWLNVLCSLFSGMNLVQALHFGWAELEEKFKDDQFFWDLRTEENNEVFFYPFELLKAALDIFRGRDYLYHDESPLICRCFGIRESDVLEHVRTEPEPTLATLNTKTKAGMGCRSCVPQLTRMLAVNAPATKTRFYKDRPIAEWMLDIDSALKNFFEGADWKLEVQSFKGNQVIISFDKEVSQKTEEEMATLLQRFLGAEVDGDLGFFMILIRDLQRLKAAR